MFKKSMFNFSQNFKHIFHRLKVNFFLMFQHHDSMDHRNQIIKMVPNLLEYTVTIFCTWSVQGALLNEEKLIASIPSNCHQIFEDWDVYVDWGCLRERNLKIDREGVTIQDPRQRTFFSIKKNTNAKGQTSDLTFRIG